jgi:hypothetical protein
MHMNSSPKASTLTELRAKTDRQLITLIGTRLDRGLAFARSLADDEAHDRWVHEFFTRAQEARSEARAWLPFVQDPERRRLELKLAELGHILDGLAQPEMRVHAACS